MELGVATRRMLEQLDSRETLVCCGDGTEKLTNKFRQLSSNGAERLDTVFQRVLSTALTFSYVDFRVPMEGISMEAHSS